MEVPTVYGVGTINTYRVEDDIVIVKYKFGTGFLRSESVSLFRRTPPKKVNRNDKGVDRSVGFDDDSQGGGGGGAGGKACRLVNMIATENREGQDCGKEEDKVNDGCSFEGMRKRFPGGGGTGAASVGGAPTVPVRAVPDSPESERVTAYLSRCREIGNSSSAYFFGNLWERLVGGRTTAIALTSAGEGRPSVRDSSATVSTTASSTATSGVVATITTSSGSKEDGDHIELHGGPGRFSTVLGGRRSNTSVRIDKSLVIEVLAAMAIIFLGGLVFFFIVGYKIGSAEFQQQQSYMQLSQVKFDEALVYFDYRSRPTDGQYRPDYEKHLTKTAAEAINLFERSTHSLGHSAVGSEVTTHMLKELKSQVLNKQLSLAAENAVLGTQITAEEWEYDDKKIDTAMDECRCRAALMQRSARQKINRANGEITYSDWVDHGQIGQCLWDNI